MDLTVVWHVVIAMQRSTVTPLGAECAPKDAPVAGGALDVMKVG